jgi:hypothetical protein
VPQDIADGVKCLDPSKEPLPRPRRPRPPCARTSHPGRACAEYSKACVSSPRPLLDVYPPFHFIGRQAPNGSLSHPVRTRPQRPSFSDAALDHDDVRIATDSDFRNFLHWSRCLDYDW